MNHKERETCRARVAIEGASKTAQQEVPCLDKCGPMSCGCSSEVRMERGGVYGTKLRAVIYAQAEHIARLEAECAQLKHDLVDLDSEFA